MLCEMWHCFLVKGKQIGPALTISRTHEEVLFLIPVPALRVILVAQASALTAGATVAL